MKRSLVAVLLLVVALPANAWHPLGHRLVARLAEARLAPDTRAEVRRLLALEGHRTLADVANWADDVRAEGGVLGKRSEKWHYVNIGEHDCAYDAARACPGGDCVVEAINAQAAILADRARPDAERLQALKFVVHFTGDVHQPFHAGYARDRGGNKIQVNYNGRGSNLHALWDGTLLGSRDFDELPYYWWLRITDTTQPESFSAVAPVQWAERSCKIALQPGVYPARARIGDDYIATYRPVAERAIQRGGLRLAELLNVTVGRPASR